MPTLQQTAELPPDHDMLTGRAQAVRLTTQNDTMVNLPIRRVRLEYQRPDRKWALLRGFIQVGTPPRDGSNYWGKSFGAIEIELVIVRQF